MATTASTQVTIGLTGTPPSPVEKGTTKLDTPQDTEMVTRMRNEDMPPMTEMRNTPYRIMRKGGSRHPLLVMWNLHVLILIGPCT